MAAAAPTPEGVVAITHLAGTSESAVRIDRPLIQRSQAGEGLEGGAGRIVLLSDPVVQRSIDVLNQLSPHARFQMTRDHVGIETRFGHQSQNETSLGVHGHRRPLTPRETLLGQFLQTRVDGEEKIVAGYSLLQDRVTAQHVACLGFGHPLTSCVDHHLNQAVPAPELALPGMLHADLADHIALPITLIFQTLQVLGVDLSHIAQQVAGQGMVRIGPLGFGPNLHALDGPDLLLQHGQFSPAHLPTNQHR